MPKQKKKIIDEIIEEEFEFEKIEEDGFEHLVLSVEKPLEIEKPKKLKEHIVLASNSSKVYFLISPDCACFTKNIWGNKLVPGDIIYLEV